MRGITRVLWRTTVAASLALLGQGALCSDTLTVYDDEADFLRDAPIASSEGFDEMSPQSWRIRTIEINEVHYTIEDKNVGEPRCEPGGWSCWAVTQEGGAISPPNVLHTFPEKNETATLRFGANDAVRAIGFYYYGGVQNCGSRFRRSQIRVVEVGGAETYVDVSIRLGGSVREEFRYFGFLSATGIYQVEIDRDPLDSTCYSLSETLFDTVSRSDITSTVWLDVSIDIHPWSDRNMVEPGSTRLFPVAIHGSGYFDALQCDLRSLRLAPGDAESRNYRVMDVNRDGYMDMVAYFRSKDIQVGCGDTEMLLTGSTHQGDEVRGSDTVTNMRCP